MQNHYIPTITTIHIFLFYIRVVTVVYKDSNETLVVSIIYCHGRLTLYRFDIDPIKSETQCMTCSLQTFSHNIYTNFILLYLIVTVILVNCTKTVKQAKVYG